MQIGWACWLPCALCLHGAAGLDAVGGFSGGQSVRVQLESQFYLAGYSDHVPWRIWNSWYRSCAAGLGDGWISITSYQRDHHLVRTFLQVEIHCRQMISSGQLILPISPSLPSSRFIKQLTRILLICSCGPGLRSSPRLLAGFFSHLNSALS